jgi:hypothetical protein
MAVNFASIVYLPCFDTFARPVTIVPIASQPSAPSYSARGIFDHNELDFDVFGETIYSDGKIELDILMSEFSILPRQHDVVIIPPHEGAEGGNFEVSDRSPGNAGGEMTLTLRELVEAKGPLLSYTLVGSGFSLHAPAFATPALTVL